MSYNSGMAPEVQAFPQTPPAGIAPQATEVAEARRDRRSPLASQVRVGWIGDHRRMTYAEVQGVDFSENGLAIRAQERLRISALVHIEIPERGQTAIGRVCGCVPCAGGWRIGFELMDGLRPSRNAQ